MRIGSKLCFIRVSRPCYNKWRRCPGWAGPGWKTRKVPYCDNGFFPLEQVGDWWKWKPWTCQVCRTWVLPVNVEKLDPSFWKWRLSVILRNWWWDRVGLKRATKRWYKGVKER